MFSVKGLLAASATLSFIASSVASGGKNVAVYWGSGADQKRLSTFCDESDIDIIPIGFLELFPQQGNGFPKENFGNACWGGSVYYGPGPNHDADQLYTQCPTVQEDIPYCQSKGKKIVLSLGGESKNYQLTGVAAGIAFADWLWGAYGPLTDAWTAAGGVRPLDRGASNTSDVSIAVDGFDFDIEHAAIDLSQGYIACIQRLRSHFSQQTKKTYLITGAPQCFLPELNMGSMIAQAQFDVLFIQFYNNPSCSARNWADNSIDINYNTWKSEIARGASAGAQLYIGLVGAPTLGSDCEKASYGEYIDAAEADTLIKKYSGDSAFGGVMLWEATVALNNECNCKPFYSVIKDSLNGISPPSASKACPVTSTTTSASSTSSSSSIRSSATSSVVSTTSSSSSASSTSVSQSSSDISTSSSASVTSTASSSASTSSSDSSTLSSTSPNVSVTSTASSSSQLSTSSSSSAPVTSLTSSSSSAISSDLSTSSDISSTATSISSSVSVTSSDISSSSSKSTVVTSSSSTEVTSSTSLSSVSTTESSKFPTFTPPYGNGTKTTSTSSATISPTIITTDTSVPTGTDVPLTTSTVYTTKTGTVTKCPATVTNCPVGAVTTETIALYTTVCPVGNNGGVPTSSPVISAPPETPNGGYTTSTVFTTKISTITSCAPGIACAGKPGDVVTEVIPLYTTVCPVGNSPVGNNGGVQTAAPAVSAASATPGIPAEYSTSTIYSTKVFTITACAPGVVCAGNPSSVVTQVVPISSIVYPIVASPTPSSKSSFTTYVTIKLASSASAAIGTPLAPYPTPSKSHIKHPYGSGTGTAYSYTLKPTGTSAPSVQVEIVKVSPIPVNSVKPGFTKAGGGAKAVAATGTPVSPSATPSVVTTNSASGFGTSSVVVIISAVVVGVLMM